MNRNDIETLVQPTAFSDSDGVKRVAIIIPCFNHGRFLADALKSAFSQTRRADQIVIVNDGSTDNTAEIARQFKAADYVLQENRGLAAARNAGLVKSAADFVLFLDSDDVLLSNAIESCLSAFIAQPGAAFVYGGFRLVDASRNLISEIRPAMQRDHYAALLRGNHIAMHGTVMYNANILRSAGGFDVKLRCCEDYDVYLRLASKYPIGIYREISAEYRLHADNMSRNAAMMLRGALFVLGRHGRTAKTTREWRLAYAEGLRFWRGYYGREVIEQIVVECNSLRRLDRLNELVAVGLCYDPKFVLRLARRFQASVSARLRRRSGPAC
jgi:glycosyltransferase involved in cell wall biosynthesis